MLKMCVWVGEADTWMGKWGRQLSRPWTQEEEKQQPLDADTKEEISVGSTGHKPLTLRSEALGPRVRASARQASSSRLHSHLQADGTYGHRGDRVGAQTPQQQELRSEVLTCPAPEPGSQAQHLPRVLEKLLGSPQRSKLGPRAERQWDWSEPRKPQQRQGFCVPRAHVQSTHLGLLCVLTRGILTSPREGPTVTPQGGTCLGASGTKVITRK